MSKINTLFDTYGQSLWLDYIDRNLLVAGGLESLVTAGLRGVTSNPSIFHNAIADGTDYNDSIHDLLQADSQADANMLYDWLVLEDIRLAADQLRAVYQASHGLDGFVSLEVPPDLANDTVRTIEAARHLWKQIDRPNLMIKVPGTLAGLPAIETLIAEGINVNVTLLFSVRRYEQVMDAYIRGLIRNPEPASVASVASFFVSRVDSAVDAELDRLQDDRAESLKGRIAIANARLAYRKFRDRFSSQEFEEQRRRGARVQRPLWASTGTKNPAYSDVRYIEGLIGRETVNTVPPDTLDAFISHGEMVAALDRDPRHVEQDLETLEALGIDLEAITARLEQEGIEKFAASYQALLELLEHKRLEIGRRHAHG